MNEYKILKTYRKTNDKEIYLVAIDGKNRIYKKIIDKENKKLYDTIKNEAFILKRLDKLNIAPHLYSYSPNENYIIIEYIEGTVLTKATFSSFKEKISVVLKIASCLIKIHELGIVHCDLKPDNIILNGYKDIKIIDYGIASVYGNNAFKEFGSVKYYSPKKTKTELIDPIVDIYSLGIILYELIYFHNPFGNKKDEIIKNKKENKFLEVDNKLLNLIFTKCFDSSYEKRYKNVKSFYDDLKLLL